MWSERTKTKSSTLKVGVGDRRDLDDEAIRSAAAASGFGDLVRLEETGGKLFGIWN